MPGRVALSDPRVPGATGSLPPSVVKSACEEKALGLFDYPGSQESKGTLDEIVFLADLSPEEWARILKLLETRIFRKGDALIRSGEQDSSFYILADGEVEVTIGDKVLAVISKGSVFGEIAFFDGAPRSATIRARTGGTAIRVTQDHFETLAAWEPLIARKLLFDLGRILAMRLRWTTSLKAA